MNESVLIVGGGFTGLSLAFDLVRKGVKVKVLEADAEVGGLAGTFEVGGQKLEKFYHHWFNNDQHVMDLIEDLGAKDKVRLRATRTGMFYSNKVYRLSTPLDLFRFKALSFAGRVRLGLLALKARRVKDWKVLEKLSASQWLRDMAGEEVYQVVWEPLLRGKFGEAAEDVSAVWMWNKLKLRGGSRGSKGEERLAYFEGGFKALLDKLVDYIVEHGGQVITNSEVQKLVISEHRIIGVETSDHEYKADIVVLTTPLPISARLLCDHVSKKYLEIINRIKFLANICVVLELEKSLSSTYWLNVNDPTFPFVAVIEHTNFEDVNSYGGRHIVYLSKYLPETDKLYSMSDDEAVAYSLENLKKMFPNFSPGWLLRATVWRGKYSQPIVEKNYSQLIPDHSTEIKNLFINTMAQIYPEDRGTNYAIREGRSLARKLVNRQHY